MKKTLFVLMVVVGLITTIIAITQHCTGVFTGIVKNEKGEALSNVSIDVVQNLVTIDTLSTDQNGCFDLSALPKGDYELHISHPEYRVLTKKISHDPDKKQSQVLKLERLAGEQDAFDPTTLLPGIPLTQGVARPAGRARPASTGSGGGGLQSFEAGSAGGAGSYSIVGGQGFAAPGGLGTQSPHVLGNTEEYSALTRNIFHSPLDQPLSTFSIDVDTAFYAQLRNMLNFGRLPAANSVRIEELINYFNYDYPEPMAGQDFSVYTELGTNPWNAQRQLLHIGIQGRKLDLSKTAPSNLVFLIDVSGSMSEPNKLPLVKESMKLLAEQLRPRDRVAIAVYAGKAGLVLPSSDGGEKNEIIRALDKLQAGGSTAGGAGIRLAYKTAEENFIKGGNNRIILCTDGDFNVGVSSTAELTEMIENYRKKGIYLSILGYGMGNYKDNRMEELSNKGNGNYAYIDNMREAKKVLVDQLAGTLYTIAKDVKFQIEFNPAHVKAYRLVGYENRMLKAEDFKDDTKDAGELGAGHTVTAIYEIIPAGSKEKIADVDVLKYQENKLSDSASNEMATVKIRYKKPDKDVSTPLNVTVNKEAKAWKSCSDIYNWANAVAGFGLLISDSEHKGDLSWNMVQNLARRSVGEDTEGWRNEFIQLISQAARLSKASPDEPRDDDDWGFY